MDLSLSIHIFICKVQLDLLGSPVLDPGAVLEFLGHLPSRISDVSNQQPSRKKLGGYVKDIHMIYNMQVNSFRSGPTRVIVKEACARFAFCASFG